MSSAGLVAELAAGPGWPADPDSDDTLPLAGVRVLDLSRVLAGPFATMVLGDLGADVIKVERPHAGDDTRHWGPPFHGEDATYFLSVNRNRRSVTLDLKSDHGSVLVRHLAAHADVVVENFLPRHLVSLGLEEIRESSSDTVWVSIRGATSSGPSGGDPGYDAMVQARSGLMSITGHDTTGPTKVGVAIADVVTGLYAAVSALTGLLARSRGRGSRHIEIPLLESAVSALVNQAANYLVGGQVPQLLGNAHPNIAPYGPLATADRPLMVGAGNDEQFERLCGLLDIDHVVDDERFRTNRARVQHRDELRAELESVLRQQPASVWLRRLSDVGIPASLIQNLEEVFSDHHVREVGLVDEVEHPAGPLAQVRSPLVVDERRPPVRRAPPLLGQHTASVLEMLGAAPDTIDEIIRQTASERDQT